MGYDNVRNYSSGWSEWSTVYVPDPSVTEGGAAGYRQEPSGRPIVVGAP